jgi:hypothetical protein
LESYSKIRPKMLYFIPCNSLISFSLKWRCCSLIWPKSLWQIPVLTTLLSWNRLLLLCCHLCSVQKHSLTVNRTKYRQSQSTLLSVIVYIHVLSFLSFNHGADHIQNVINKAVIRFRGFFSFTMPTRARLFTVQCFYILSHYKLPRIAYC